MFTYTDSQGSGPRLTASDRVNPDPKTAGQSTRLFSVRDSRGSETTFAYAGSGAGQDRWKLVRRTDRLNRSTTFSYDTVARRTTVTNPLSQATKVDYDANGHPRAITNALAEVRSLTWTADRHVASLTEPGNSGDTAPRTTEYEYNDNDYLTKQIDKRETTWRTTQLDYDNFPVDTVLDVTGRWRSGRAIPHISQLARVTAPRGTQTPTVGDFQWRYGYDENQTDYTGQRGNLSSVADPEGSVTRYLYNAQGLVKQATDPRSNVTTLGYDAGGLPTSIQAPEGRLTRMGYDADGLLLWVQDPNHAGEPATPATCVGADVAARAYRSCLEYDAFHRLRQQSAPKSTAFARGTLLWSSADYDANDNLRHSFAPAEGAGAVQSTAITAYDYDAMDRMREEIGPDDETPSPSGGTLQEKTTYGYDLAGRLERVTLPRGNATATVDDFTTQLTLDAIGRTITETRFGTSTSDLQRMRYCYDRAGDLRSVTRPRGDTATHTCSPYGSGTHTWKQDYWRNHELKVATDPQGNANSFEYDANGNVSATTDPESTRVTLEYNGRDQLAKRTEPFDATHPSVVTKYEYDAAGNLVRFVRPRAWDTAPNHASYAGRDYVTSYAYDGVNRQTLVTLPTDAGSIAAEEQTRAAYIHRVYDANGNVTMTTLPTDTADVNAVRDEHETSFTYFDPGWVRSKRQPGRLATDPPRLAPVDYEYVSLADRWERSRVARGEDGSTRTTLWRFYKDGTLRDMTGRDGSTNSYTYDVHNNLVRASVASGGGQDPGDLSKLIVAGYDGFDRLGGTREQRAGQSTWRVSTFGYDVNDNLMTRTQNATAATETGSPSGGRQNTFTYRTNDWLQDQTDLGNNAGSASDDRKIALDYLPTGWRKSRTIAYWNATSGSFAVRQRNEWGYSKNGLKTSVKIYKGTNASDLRESHTLDYYEPLGTGSRYLNGHRVKDSFVQSSPNPKCPPGGASCVRSYTFDAQDRVEDETLALPGSATKTRSYDLDTAGNIEIERIDGAAQRKFIYLGERLTELQVPAGRGGWTASAKYRYDPYGNLDCVTTALADVAAACSSFSGTPDQQLLARHVYDALDRMRISREYTGGTAQQVQRSSRYDYDALNRPTRHFHATRRTATAPLEDKTTTFTYNGLTDEVTQGAGAAARACSFGGFTSVLMADGSKKPIRDVVVGDQVIATDPETGEQKAKRVTRVWHHDDTVIDLVLDGEVITTTEDHPFWNATDGEFQAAGDIDCGEKIVTADGRLLVVRGLRSARFRLAYNLSVNGIHTYHVGKHAILVHNQCGRAFDVTAGELANETNVLRRHPINREQLEGGERVGHGGVQNLSNEDLIRFGGPHGDDPISGARIFAPGYYPNPGSLIEIWSGHHRVFEIGRRVREGSMSPDTVIPFLRRR